MIDLEHVHILELAAEAQRTRVIAGSENDHLLDSIGGLGQQRLIEAAQCER